MKNLRYIDMTKILDCEEGALTSVTTFSETKNNHYRCRLSKLMRCIKIMKLCKGGLWVLNKHHLKTVTLSSIDVVLFRIGLICKRKQILYRNSEFRRLITKKQGAQARYNWIVRKCKQIDRKLEARCDSPFSPLQNFWTFVVRRISHSKKNKNKIENVN